jgi:ABC-2 type transport system ATP-binding protein
MNAMMAERVATVTAIIETTGLRKSFGTGDATVEAVRGVDLRVETGQIFGFLGPNGAGKTTTLRMLVTLLAPTAGEARVAGLDLRRQPAQVRHRIGYVAQGFSSARGMTGRGELVMQGRMYGMNARDASARASEVLEHLDLVEAADRTTGTYSGGMRRRLDVGLGITHRPALLFLDEPTTGLDPQARAGLWQEITSLRESGTTVFLTTHYLDEADALCDRLAIIDHGQIVVEGTPDELKRQIAGDVVTIGVPERSGDVLRLVEAQPFVREAGASDGLVRAYVDQGEAALPVLLRLLDAQGLAPQTLSLHRPSLDDVFLRQTGRSLRDAA